MTETQSLAIDILKLVPNDSTCFINAPSIYKDSGIIKLLQPSTQYDWQLNLSKENKNGLIEVILKENIECEFHMLTIEHDGIPLFTAYDGMCGVLVNKLTNIPEWFSRKYEGTLMFERD